MNVIFQVDAPGPVSSLSVGENFTLEVFVQDARGADATGINQAYFDLAYNTSLVSVTGPVTHGADFNVDTSGDTSTPGQINNAGGLSTTSVPPSPANATQLLFSVPMQAVGGGQFNLTPSLSTNPSDIVLFFFSATGVPLSSMNFSGLPVSVNAGPAVTSIVTADNSPTNANQVHYTVNFNEPVTVDNSDFGLAQSGITGSTIATISPSSGLNSSYTVTVNAGSLTSSTGTLGLNLTDGDAIVDSASNTLAGGHTGNTLVTGAVYTIDRTAPTVSSIVTASPNPTNAASVNYTVSFSKAVTGVAASDFKLVTAGGISGASIGSITGSGTTYTVNVSTGSGDGTLGLNLIDGPAKISDAAGNTLAGGNSGSTIFTGQTYSVRKTPPAVTAITLVNSSPTNAASVQFAVTFNEAVSNVGAADFALVASGVSGALISNVAGSGANWTITAGTGSGNGTLGLNFIDGSTQISDAAGNSVAGGNTGNVLFTGPTSYTIDKTPLSVNSFTRVESSPTNRSSVDFTITFNTSVTGLTQADFALVASGVSGASVTNLSGSGATYTITASTGSGNGTLGLNLIDGPNKISDAAGNSLAGGNTDNVLASSLSYTIDKTPVSISSIALAQSSPTNAASVSFTVTFNTSITGLTQADFGLAASGVSGASISSLTGSGATYTVTVNTGSGSGALGLNLVDGPAKISDSAGNTLAGGNTGTVLSTGAAYTIDRTPIAVNSIALVQSSTNNLASVSFTITFNKSVSGLTQADLALNSTGISGASITNLTGSGSTYTVTANTGTGNGRLGFNLIDGSALISDAAGNTLAGGNSAAVISSSPLYTVDKTPVSVSSITLAQASPTNQPSVGFTVTFNTSVTGVAQADFALVASGVTGASIMNISGSGATFTVTVNTGSGNGTLGLNLIDGSAKISDAAGNTLAGGNSGSIISTGTAYTIDKTPISVSSITLFESSPNNRAQVDFTVTFNKSVSGVTQADFALSGSGLTGAAITNVSGSGASFTVTASTGSGAGTLGLNLVDGSAKISDAAGNTLAGGSSGTVLFTGPTYSIDKVAISVSSIARVQTSPTNLASLSFTVTFNKSVSGLAKSDFALAASGVSGASITNLSGSGATYTVTVNSGSGNGTLGLNLINGPAKISDAAGNTLAGGNTGSVLSTGPVYTIDKTPLVVNSIALVQTSPTNLASVSFTVTFNKSVTGLTKGDFALAASGVNGATITNLSGSGATYTVSVGTGSGSGTLGLNLIDGSAKISDAAGNTLAGGNTGTVLTTGPTYTIDKTPVSVSSFTAVNGTTTNLASVAYTVTFNKPVTGLTQADFALATTALSGASISNLSGSGTTYTVTVSTGSGNGTLKLNLIDGSAKISDAAGNTLAGGNSGTVLASGPTYTIDKTPVTANSIVLVESSSTNLGSVDFTVTFNKSVTGVTQSDFSLVASSLSGASITNVFGSGATYTVTASTGSGNGSLGLDLVDGPSKISDAAGNTLAGGNTGAVLLAGPAYMIDKVPIGVTSIALVQSSPTNLASVSFTVTFNKSVTGLTQADFALAATGLTGAAITNLSGSGTSYTVTASTGSGNGTLGLNLIDGSAKISDAAGNTLAGGNSGTVLFSSAGSYSIDKTPISVSSMTLVEANPTHLALVDFTVTFNKSVSGLAQSDFALVVSGISGASIRSLTGSGTTYTVTATTGSGNGTLGLSLVDGSATISDAAGNTLAGGNSGSTLFTTPTPYTINKTPPSVQSIALTDASPTHATTVDFTVTFSESVSGVTAGDFAITGSGLTGASITNVTGSGSSYTVTANTGSGDGTLGLDLIDGSSTISDAAGNTVAGGDTLQVLFAGQSLYTIVKSLPAVTSIAPTGSTPTNASSVSFTVTFNRSVTGVAASDFSPVASVGITGAAVTNVSGAGSSWTVTLSTGTGDGTLGLDLIDGSSTISDDAGNTLAGGSTLAVLFAGSTPYTIDKTPPGVTAITDSDVSPTAAAVVQFGATFTESVSGVVASDFALAESGGLSGASITSVSGSGAAWTVTVSTGTGNGTLGLNFVDGPTPVTDAAGNKLGGGNSGATLATGDTYTLDRTLPTVVSIVPGNASPTNQTSVTFTATFSESVTGVDTTDFAPNAVGISGAAVTGVSGSGSSYTVTVNTGTGSGTLALNLIDGDKITDATNKTLAGGKTGKLIFAGTPAYTIDKTPVSVSSIALVERSPTNLASVDFTVTFNKSVSGVSAADFALVASGVTAPSITGVSGSGTTWTVTANTGSGSGTIGLNLIDGSSKIIDGAGNTLAGGGTNSVLFTGNVSYTIDRSALAVNSIGLADPSPTNAAAVSFTITFDKSVTGVAQPDFALVTSGVTGASITGVTGSGTTWTVTANTGSGNGTIGLNFIDGPATISDSAGNTLAGGGTNAVLFAGTLSYTIDKSPVAVSSIALVESTPTDLSSVDFTVTFNTSVSGVAAADFALAASGLTGAAITNVSGSGATYTVTANTGTGNGTLGLDLIDGPAAISDSAGNTLAGGNTGSTLFSGATLYTVDKTPVSVTSIARVEATPTNLAAVDFTVTFNKSVTGVSAADFALVTSGLSGPSITTVSGSGASWTVTASTGSGSGTIGLNLIDGTSKIGDNAGNTLAGGGTNAVLVAGPIYTIDRSPVAVSTIAAVQSSPTNRSSVEFTVTFNKSVNGVAQADFALVTAGITGAAITNVTGSGASYTVTASTGTGNGTLGLDLIDGSSTISDGAGNTLAGGGTNVVLFTGLSLTIDKTPISVSSIVPADASPTNSASVAFTVTFNKSVSGLAASDFVLAATGLSGAAITNLSGSGATYTVTASTGSGNGTLGLNLVDGPAAISDAAGNTLAGGATDAIIFAEPAPLYTIDKTPIAVTAISLVESSPTNRSSVDFTVTFNKDVSGVGQADFALAATGVTGASITNVTGSGTTYTVTLSTGTGSGTLGLNFIDGSAKISDAAGNTAAGGNSDTVLFAGTNAYTIDKTAVAVSSIDLANSSTTNLGSVGFTVIFNKSVTGVSASDFALDASGLTGVAITSVSGSGATYTVTASTGTGNGTLGLNLIDGSATISDAAGNTLAGGNTGHVLFAGPTDYTIDKTAVTVSSIVPLETSPTNLNSVAFTVTFNKSVSGVAQSDFALAATGIAGATISSITGSGSSYTVIVGTGTGSGTLGLNLIDGPSQISDAAGNTLAGESTGNIVFSGTPSYTIDKTPVAVGSIALVEASPTNLSSVDFTVTFNKSVSGVAQADFALEATGITGAAISGLSGSGATYTVTVNTGTGNGTLGLNFIDGSAKVSDAAGNSAAGGNTGTVLFHGTNAYTIDKSAPAVTSIDLVGSSSTNQGTVSFTVTFNKSVTGVTAADFGLDSSGLTGDSITSVTGSGTTWTVTVNTGSGNGDLGLSFIDGPAKISDAAGNTVAGGNTNTVLFSGTSSYTIDKTPIAVSSIVPANSNPTHASSVAFTVTFNKSVSGVVAGDFGLAATGISGATIANVTGSGTSYSVTVTTGTGNGTLGLNLIDGPTKIADAAGNALAGGSTGQLIFTGTPVYTINKTAPAVTSIALVNHSPTDASTVQFTVTFNEGVTGVDTSDFALAAGSGISGAAITGVTGSGSTWTVTASTGSGNGTLGLNFIDGDAVTDAAGNTTAGGHTNAVIFAGPTTYTIDKTPPTVVSITPSGANPTNGGITQFTVTFSKSVTGVDSSDLSVSTTGNISGAGIASVTGSGTTWTVIANTGSGNGSLTVNLIDGDAITDAAGNTLAGGHTGATIFVGQSAETIQKTPPSVTSITLADNNPVAAPTTVHFTVKFSESVTGVDTSDFALVVSGLTGSSISTVTGSGDTWTLAAASGVGNGTLGLKLVDGDAISDTAGNTLAGGHTSATLFTGATSYNVSTPVVQSISVTGLAVTAIQGLNVTNAEVASFTAVGGSQTASDFTATIDWGDGSTSGGTIAASGNAFSVTGSHDYASPGDRPVKISVSATGGATSQGQTTATVGSHNQLYVAQLYRDLLHREAEPQGLQFWTNLLAGGTSRGQVVEGFENSIEYRDDVVEGLYRLYLHRTADTAGLAAFASLLSSGSPEQVAEALVSSPEYYQNRGGGTNAGFLNALFNDALNRNADSQAMQATAAVDFSTAANRALVAQSVFASSEYLDDLVNYPGGVANSFHDQVAFGFYQVYLGRNAGAADIPPYAAQLKNGLDSLVIAEILASDEYFARAETQG